MKTQVEIPLSENFFAACFPHRCLVCGGPSEAGEDLSLQKTVTEEGEQKTIPILLKKPFCQEHHRISNRSGYIGGALVMIVGVSMFVLGVYFSWEQPPFRTTGLLALVMVLLVGGGAAWIGGILTFLLVEFGLFPILRAITGSPYRTNLGLSASYTGENDSVVLSFENDGVAREFKELNVKIPSLPDDLPQEALTCPRCDAELTGDGLARIRASLARGDADALQVTCFGCSQMLSKQDFQAVGEAKV